MKDVKKSSVGMSVLVWLTLSALSASGTPSQVHDQSTWLLPQEGVFVPPKPRKIDEYDDIRFNDEKARLDNFAIELQNDPTGQGYIIGYGGRICRPGEAIARAKRARNYLINSRGIDAERIITGNGGYRRQVGAELYIIPQGASNPPARPTIPRCTRPKPISKKSPRRA